MIRVIVITSDTYLWCLKPFAYLFNLYWSDLQPVLVAGFARPDFPLPDNFSFHQIDKANYPSEKWSNGLIKLLKEVDDDIFVLLLEDYLLRRTVDHRGISTIAEYMRSNTDIVRFDLTADRLYGRGMRDIEPYGHYDIIECDKDAPYQMSLQAAVWRRDLLLGILKPNKSAWEVEIHTDMTQCPWRAVGTRQWPVRYANLVLKGKAMKAELDLIQEPHRGAVRKWIPHELH